MSRRIGARKERVPYLTDRAIEEHADLLLAEWAAREGGIEIPVPLDDLVEMHLGIRYAIEDLRDELSIPDVLGAIWFSTGKIVVDSSLDPHLNPSMLGRFNFTLAHEIGHWRLHRQHLRDDPTEAMLFEENAKPAFVCRSSAKPREEWQADTFAGCLLMPRASVRDAWRNWHGSDDPVAVPDLMPGKCCGSLGDAENAAMEQFCKPFAERFAASAQAMRIRLQALGLLVKEIEPELF